MKESTCKSCKAPIWWAKTQRGRSMPLDKEIVTVAIPSSDGKTVAVHRGHQSHFATCPYAEQHRSERR